MRCEDVRRHLDASPDGDLDAAERDAFDVHLAQCPECRGYAADLARLDVELRQAFAPRRAAAAAVAARVVSRLPVTTPRPAWVRSVGLAVAAAAAGFLLAVAIFRPWARPAVLPVQPVREFVKDMLPIQLAIATGAVEVESDGTWQALPTGGTVELGCSIRTPPSVRCEFRTPDGSEVRLNGGTQVVFRSPRELDLVRGQVWSSVAASPVPYRVKSPTCTVTALGTQFDLLHGAEQSRLTVVSGRTRVNAGSRSCEVAGGQYLDLSPDLLSEPQTRPNYQLLQATGWVTEILRLKGHGNPELTRRIDDLFAHIGEAKLGHLPEEEIRLLGDHCVLPLTRYLQSERSRGNAPKRQQAARILADLAQPWSIKDLIGLLEDSDREVRSRAAAGLKRLTGNAFGLEPAQWRTAAPAACDGATASWQQWWQINQFRCPTDPPGTRVDTGSPPTKAVKE